MRTLDLDIVVTRGSAVESRHVVHAAVVGADGSLLASAGRPDLVTHWRSCAKPLQAYPFVASGRLDGVGWGAAELALACASHGGEPEHVALAASMLRSIGLEEGDLACGAHDPLTLRGARLLHELGRLPGRLHNNCSGKHAAMLAVARSHSWATLGYELPTHPVQVVIRQSLARWTGLDAGALDVATDGCGVPVFILTLRQMALAYARLAAAARQEDSAARILDAMGSHPFLVGGTDRFDSVLIEATGGAVIAKVGAEGVHTVLLRDRAIGFAVKVEDGHPRAQYPAVLRLLQHLDALPASLPTRLHDLLITPVRDTRGDRVGDIRPAA
ncbi:MAG: asparaginase [Gemmatimonadaceae bacterium]|nr:asparaginase [Gemmatimonadaceae bacterium]